MIIVWHNIKNEIKEWVVAIFDMLDHPIEP